MLIQLPCHLHVAPWGGV